MKRKKATKKVIYYVIVTAIGILMIYPLLWMVMSSFKETNSIFRTAGSLIPEKFTWTIIETDGKALQRSLLEPSLKTPQ